MAAAEVAAVPEKTTKAAEEAMDPSDVTVATRTTTTTTNKTKIMKAMDLVETTAMTRMQMSEDRQSQQDDDRQTIQRAMEAEEMTMDHGAVATTASPLATARRRLGRPRERARTPLHRCPNKVPFATIPTTSVEGRR
jgi:hypothetical protein